MFAKGWFWGISYRVVFNASIAIVVSVLSGCGSAPVVPVQSHEGIVLKSKSFNKEPYYLVNKNGSRVAYAVEANDELRFSIPADVDVSQCYAVTDDRGVAFSKINVSGILSNPACAAMAAQMAGEKYEMSDAFVDAIHGAIDDAGDELIESDSVGDNMLGYAIKAGSYYVKIQNAEQCTNDFVEANFGPKQRWLQEVYNIRAEPQQSKSRCEVLVGQYNGYSSSLRASYDEENALRVHLADVQVIKEELSSEQMISPACGVSGAKLAGGEMQFNRYAIGADIEDCKLEGQAASGGVVIKKLVSGMPAVVAGLQENDVITGINGNKVTDMPTMIRLIQASHGEEIKVMYLRNSDEQTLLVKPVARVVNFDKPI